MPARTVLTHCPYCALQCGMSLSEPAPSQQSRARATGQGKPELRARWTKRPPSGGGQPGFSHQPRWAVPEGVDLGWVAALRQRLTTPLVRPARVLRWSRPAGRRRWTGSLRRSARIQAVHGPHAVAVFGGGGLTNEKAYQLGKFARVALGTAEHRLQRPVLHVVGRGGRQPGVRHRPGAAVPAGRHRRRPRHPAGRQQPGRDHAAVHAAGSPSAARRGGALIVIDPRRTATARAATLHLQLTPGTDLALANGLLHIAIARRLHRRGLHRRANHRLRRGAPGRAPAYWPERVERITGVPVAQHWPRSALLAAAGRAMVLTARGAEQHSKGVDTVSAFINLALALGLPGRRAAATAASPGRATGRAAVSTGRRPTSCPATGASTTRPPGRTSRRCGGSSPADLPGPGRSAYEMLDALGTPGGPRALLVIGSNIAVSAPRGARSRGGWPRWTSWWCATSCSPRPRRSPTSCCRSRSGPRRRAR